MDLNQKLAILEETMDLDEGTLKLEIVLSELDEWDSLSILSFVSMLDDEFSKIVTGKEVRSCKTVADLIALME